MGSITGPSVAGKMEILFFTVLYIVVFCGAVAALVWLTSPINDWLIRKHEKREYAREMKTVKREWIRCATCTRLLKKGSQAMYYTPNKVFRCADCTRKVPAGS